MSAEVAEIETSVVICAYAAERWGDLCDALAALRAQLTPPGEVIVVIDHNDHMLDRVRASFPEVVALANREQRGLSGARNTGVAAARGAIVAFLDDDAIPAPDWLAQLRAAYDTPQVLGVGGAIEPRWAGGRPDWFPEEFDWVVGCTYRGMPQTTAAVRNLIGANMSFRRAVLAEVGSFREGLGRVGKRPLGCEETELCIRVRQRWPEGVLRYEPRAVVGHRVPLGRARWAYFRARCYAEGLSKAQVARLVGRQAALASERAYATRTLPVGVVRNLVRALRQRERAGLARAATLAAGLAITSAGYAVGTLARGQG